MKNLTKKFLNFFKKVLPACRQAGPFFLITVIVFIFFWKVILKGETPMPGDFPLGVYFPWLDYKWGYAVGVPVKNPILADVPSFIYPMQITAINLFKHGILPLWNPYILAGTPYLANFQSAPFSITNIFYFVFNQIDAWSLQITFQHLLAAIFTYILLRYWKVSKFGSVLGGVVFAFSGFSIIWSQWNGHVLSASFIPLILYFEDRLIIEKKYKFGLGVSTILAFQIFSGYPQVVIYTSVAMAALLLIRRVSFKFIFLILLFSILGIGLSSLQWLPGAELLKNSQRTVEAHPYEWAFLPWKKTITFIAPDFFGNHATNNYWGPQDYTSNTGFIGVVAAVLSLISLSLIKKRREVLYLFIVVVFSLFLAYPTFISISLWKSGFLGFNAASAHRSLVLFNLAVAALAAFGFDVLERKSKSKILIFFPLVILTGFGIYAFDIHNLVALRNLVLPACVFAGTVFIVFIKPKFRLLLVLLTILELFYFGWKFTPFFNKNLIFPKTPVIEFLLNQQKPFRVVADKVIPINMLMNYGIETLEGYDAAYPKSISEFIAKINGSLGSVNSIRRYAIIDNYNSSLLDLANVKYLIIKSEDVQNFLKDKKYKLAFEDKSTAILENLNAKPRVFPGKTFYLKYLEGESVFEIDKESDGPIYISETYYPGWKAYVDGKEVKINKYESVFKSIDVPKGNHLVRLVYLPKSFSIGIIVSLVSAILTITLMIYFRIIKR